MQQQDVNSSRRGFLGKIATGAAALGAASLAAPLSLTANTIQKSTGTLADADAWFNQIKGKHRIVFDVPEGNGIFPFAWPRIFMVTNAATGTPEKECSVVVILRHNGIGYAMQDSLWAKYKFGEVFHLPDPATNQPATFNPFWKPKTPFNVPGIGPVPIGINELQESGVMFAVCDAALTVYSAVVAQGAGLNAADVKKEWVAGLLPGMQVVPSGVWAVGRAQEHNCAYCFAG
jgi:hypothetical protein